MPTKFRKIAYVLAYAVATIPLWHYIRDGRILALMVAVVTFAYLNVVLSTVEAAQPILSSEKAKTPLLGWLPDKPKYEKWWLLVRRTLKWHLLLIPPKMGLALGFMEFFHSQRVVNLSGYDWLMGYPPQIIRFIFLKPYIYYGGEIQMNFNLYPQWETVVITVLSSIGFAVVGSFLTSAVVFNILSDKATIKHKWAWVVSRFILAVFGICGFLIFLTGLYDRHVTYPCEPYTSGCTVEERIEEHNISRMQYRRNVRIGETLNISMFTLIDSGTLLNSNIMRPLLSPPLGYDSRPFVARQIVAGLLGLLLYAGVTWTVLWFVEDKE